jgi:uncharacterized membrane protein
MPEQTQNIDFLNYFNVFFMAMFLIGIPLAMKFYPPKEINGIYGYRTAFSMKNQDTWTEANTYFANIMLKLAIPTVIMGLVLVFILPIKLVVLIFAVLLLAPIFISIALTSQYLDKIFDKNGNRK